MGTLNTWVGGIGGTILVLELIVMLVLMVALNVVIVLVLRWVLRKQVLVPATLTWALAHVHRVVNNGAGLAAAPVIRTTSAWRGLRAAMHRATHWPALAKVPAPVSPKTVEDGRRRAA